MRTRISVLLCLIIFLVSGTLIAKDIDDSDIRKSDAVFIENNKANALSPEILGGIDTTEIQNSIKHSYDVSNSGMLVSPSSILPIIKLNASDSKNVLGTISDSNHPLSNPKSFDKEGIYIWCDSDGTWTVFKINKGLNTEVDFTVYALDTINVIACSESYLINQGSKVNTIKFSDNNPIEDAIIQFMTRSHLVEFTIETSADLIFIGKDNLSPGSNKFTLKNRLKVGDYDHVSQITNQIIKPSKGDAKVTGGQSSSKNPSNADGGN